MGDVPNFGIDDGGFCWLWLRLLRVFGSFWRGRDVAEPIVVKVLIN